MYALKRFIAYAIDLVLIFIPIQTYSMELHAYLQGHVRIPPLIENYFWIVETAVPVLIIGTLVGLFGRSPGKLITFLKVTDESHRPPGLAQGIIREVIKLVGGMFLFGALYAIYGIVTSGRAFYDDWLSLRVDDLKPTGLTDRQKKWREFSKANRD